MGIMHTLLEYGHSAYEGLKKPAAAKPEVIKPQDKTVFESDSTVNIKTDRQPLGQKKSVSVNSYRENVGRDTFLLQATLRQKLAEFSLPPNTVATLTRNTDGTFNVEGNIPEGLRRQISEDLNQNPEIQRTFLRLKEQKPTLDYVENVLRIQDAYGGENTLFDSLISTNTQYNSLSDIAQRYSKLGESTITQIEDNSANRSKSDNFVVSVNA